MERDRFGPVAIHSTPRNFLTSARKFWLNGLRPMLRFRKLENFSSLFISVYLYVICSKTGFRPESVADRVRSKTE